MPKLNGATHVNLTVRDLARSSDWYCRALGFTLVREAEPEESGFRFHTLLHESSLASIVLGAARNPATEPFDEHRVGLHHLGYHVPARADLDEWAGHLDGAGVAHSGVKELFLEAGYGIWLRDPDNIWLEFYWVNAEFFMNQMRQRWRATKRTKVAEARKARQWTE
ncbi:VOC family protein [Amycolatopsis minnesotensis]|uniref:VOC domain-containing protein n=1 Tax=Amycolatopsis minnesotensis TaxID=337894 RepID=A0ABN2QLV9_9PSEU